MTYDLLLINAHRQYDAESGFQCDWLGIYQLASYMEQNGYSARAFSGYAHEVIPLLEQELPAGVKIVGFSCDYENQSEVEQFCRLVRSRWQIPVIVGGPQAVGLDGTFLLKSDAAAVVCGEGEIPLLALMQYFVDGTGRLENIPGIVYRKGNKVCRTPLPPPIKNLDSLPFIDPSLVLGKRFRANTISILTARGCPFRCAFCYEGGNTRSVRWRSVGNVMEELRQSLESNPHIRFVLFTDDTFTLNPGRVRKFCEALSEYRRQRDFCWFAEAHPLTILNHPELLRSMVEAGLASLQIGVESGNQSTLRAYNKKTNPIIIEDAVHLCHESNIPHLIGNIIVGGAFETEESISRSQEFGLRLLEYGEGMLELHAVHFWPLPNTAMTKRPHDFGMEILDAHSKTSAMDYPVVRCGELTPELLSARRFEMEAMFKKKIHEIAKNLSVETILRIFHYWHRYNLCTEYTNTLLQNNRIRRFASLIDNNATRRSTDIPENEIPQWHPQRQCQPLAFNNKYYADDIQIDAEAYKVLVASAGRMTVHEAAKYCKMTIDEFLDVTKRLENILALAFCPY